MKNLIYLAVLMLATCYGINAQEIRRVRIDLETPSGHTRQLLLGFTPDNSATDGFDYGYDTPKVDSFLEDFSWIINNNKYIIQGVGMFEVSKRYPIGFFLSNSGEISIRLNSIENFEQPISVYIYDAHENSYTFINDQTFVKTVSAGVSIDRYFIAFEDHNISQNLSVGEVNIEDISLKFNKLNNRLELKFDRPVHLNTIEIYNQLGKQLMYRSFEETNDRFSLQLSVQFSEVLILKIHTKNGLETKNILLL